MSDPIRLPADQVLIDGDRIIVVVDGEPLPRNATTCRPSGRACHWTVWRSCDCSKDHLPAWMTAATEPCETCAPGASCDWGHCNNESVGFRENTLTDIWVPVCQRHSTKMTQDRRPGCINCHDGRPILTIEVEPKRSAREFGHEPGQRTPCSGCGYKGILTYRLTASEVLPIVDGETREMFSVISDRRSALILMPNGHWLLICDGQIAGNGQDDIPPAATPGQFALIGEVI